MKGRKDMESRLRQYRQPTAGWRIFGQSKFLCLERLTPSAGIEVKNHSNSKVMIKYQEKYKALEFHVVVNGNPDTSLASLYRNPISLMFVTRTSLPGTKTALLASSATASTQASFLTWHCSGSDMRHCFGLGGLIGWMMIQCRSPAPL